MKTELPVKGHPVVNVQFPVGTDKAEIRVLVFDSKDASARPVAGIGVACNDRRLCDQLVFPIVPAILFLY